MRLNACVRSSDLVARLGGDEFVVLTHGALGVDGVAELAQRIEAAFRTPVAVREGARVSARASVGGTRFRAGEDSRQVLHRADTAMYQAKKGNLPVLH